MKSFLFSHRLAALVATSSALLGAVATPAQAASPWSERQQGNESEQGEGAGCANPFLSQPFLWAGDSNWYAPLPGESYDRLSGAGWSLSGGASFTSTTLADWTNNYVLDLPTGSEAVSPTMCVKSGYETARMMYRDLGGAQGVQVFASYAEGNDVHAGHLKGRQSTWELSETMNLGPSDEPGWQLVRFRFVPTGSGAVQLYNFYVDPRIVG